MSMSLKNQLHLLWLFLIRTYNEIFFFNRFIPAGIGSQLTITLFTLLRRFIFVILSVGPIPNHVAFILDGNRRYAKKKNLAHPDGHKAGFSNLICILRYCFELGIKYVTVYAFSIDNFRRKPQLVRYLMDFLREKIDELILQESVINEYGVKLQFVGNLKLLPEYVRVAIEKATTATAHNNQMVLLICVAYTSSDEILHAVQESCKEKWNEVRKGTMNSNVVISKIKYDNSRKDIINSIKDGVVVSDDVRRCCVDEFSEAEITSCSRDDEISEESKYDQTENQTIKLDDVEKHLYMSIGPDPDILIRTSGETRLSNFLLWQTDACLLYSPAALWPEIGLRHMVWAILNFQRHYFYFEKKKNII